MYSVVLMAALASGSGAADWCHHGHSYGHGAPYYWGEWANNCTGFYGGSYYGIPCGGYGCWGGYGGSGCYGCYGGHWGGAGGWGAIDYNCFGCHGCYGCYGVFTCAGYAPGGPAAVIPEQIPPPRVEEKKGGTGAIQRDRAKVVVQLPAGAKLFVDDQPIKTTEARQQFSTPRLQPGQTYFYEVRAEAVRDGKTLVETQRVLVRPGQEVTVSFPKLDLQNADVASASRPRQP